MRHAAICLTNLSRFAASCAAEPPARPVLRRPDCLSESEPFEIERFRFEGSADPNSPVPHVKLVGTPRRERGSLPLIHAVATL